jgi:malonyl CoA-acyl carrier protein transacylase
MGGCSLGLCGEETWGGPPTPRFSRGHFVLIENATRAVINARQRHNLELIERTRLRRLVEKIDAAIEACEETHLQGIKEVPEDLSKVVSPVMTFARRAVRLSGDVEAMARIEEFLGRRQVKITEVMDILWSIQETVFDLMLPWRTQLPEDVEPQGDTNGIWRQFQAIA